MTYGLLLSGGNDAKAERIAKSIVKPLSVADTEKLIHISGEDEQKLYAAIAPDYPALQQRVIDFMEAARVVARGHQATV